MISSGSWIHSVVIVLMQKLPRVQTRSIRTTEAQLNTCGPGTRVQRGQTPNKENQPNLTASEFNAQGMLPMAL